MVEKVRIKAGPVEFEYEGETAFAIEDVKELFSHIETLFKVPSLREVQEQHANSDANFAGADTKPPGGNQKLHVSSVAAKLGVKSGPDLMLAAAATLQIYDGKDRFTRAELAAVMKEATKFYRTSYTSNLTSYFNTLVGPKLNQLSENVYSLTASEYQSLEARLA